MIIRFTQIGGIAKLVVYSLIGLALINNAPFAQAMQKRPKVQSGETQVVARIGKREITINELRIEMLRLGLSDASTETERFALQSIINRHLLISAAQDADLHRSPEALLHVKAAQEQALADFYLSTASQPPEPSLDEIEDYISANPELFARRKQYTFQVLSLDTSIFDAEKMTPLFGETKDFTKFKSVLEQAGIAFDEKPLVQVSSSFPLDIRRQLAQYTINDNIIIQSNDETQIMKITKAALKPVPSKNWPAIARRIVMEENSVARARSLLDSLKLGTRVVYFRNELVPPVASSSEVNSQQSPNLKKKPTTPSKITGK